MMANGNTTYIYLLNGTYLGFISGDNLFSRDSIYLGWIDNGIVWGKDGYYRGKVAEFNGKTYIIKQSFNVNPIPRIPKIPPIPPIPPIPVPNIPATIPPLGTIDGFTL